MTNKNIKEHRAPWECSFGAEDKNKCKAGIKPKSDREYFKVLSLCILQAGLSWSMVRKIWPKVKPSFHGFNINVLSNKRPSDILKKPNTIKNQKKIESIIYNARKFELLKKKYGSFDKYLQSLKSLRDKEVIKVLSSDFNHVGEYSVEYFLHSVGYWE